MNKCKERNKQEKAYLAEELFEDKQDAVTQAAWELAKIIVICKSL